MTFIRRHPVLAYFALGFGITWMAILLLTVPSGVPADTATVSRLLPIVFAAMIAGPSVACLTLTGLLDGKAGYRRMISRLAAWRIGWFASLLLVAPVLLLIILGLLSLFSPALLPGVVATTDKLGLVAISLAGGLAAGVFEELGWTGFAMPRLLSRHGWFATGLLIGIPWAIWHGLADFWGGAVKYGEWYLPHVLLWVVALSAYRVLMTRAYRATQSLSLAMLLHVSFTGSQGLFGPISIAPAYDVLWYAIFAAALWIVVVAVFILARRTRTSPAGRIAARSWVGQSRRTPAALLIFGALWGVYLGLVHPWLMNWGATPAEQAMPLPGDELATGQVTYFTRAITIDARPTAVWPWIAQIGQDRAGFYSNSWLENITGSNIHNADSIHPEWQDRAIGDVVPLARPDLLFGFGAVGRTDIFVLDPPQVIGNIPGRFVLIPLDGQQTRLIVREAIQADAGLHSAGQGPTLTRWLVWDPMHFVMVQRMMRGIKERAEGQPLVSAPVMLAARLGWVLAGAALAGLFLSRRQWRPWLAVPILLVLPALSASADLDAALAGFLAIGITLLGALAYGRRWWPAFLLLASGVAFILVLAPDAYAAFGLLFVGVALARALNVLRQAAQHVTPRRQSVATLG